jgi:hypothetical protein
LVTKTNFSINLQSLKGVQDKGIPININNATVHCQIIEMAKVPKMRPQTKHLNIKYHHFCEHFSDGLLSIHAVKTEDQIANIFTKPVSKEVFQLHCNQVTG